MCIHTHIGPSTPVRPVGQVYTFYTEVYTFCADVYTFCAEVYIFCADVLYIPLKRHVCLFRPRMALPVGHHPPLNNPTVPRRGMAMP